MPNYRYHTPDYMRRNNTDCPPPAPPIDALSSLPIAMAYVPWQDWCAIYDVRKGFHFGTIFEELNKPFKGIGGCC